MSFFLSLCVRPLPFLSVTEIRKMKTTQSVGLYLLWQSSLEDLWDWAARGSVVLLSHAPTQPATDFLTPLWYLLTINKNWRRNVFDHSLPRASRTPQCTKDPNCFSAVWKYLQASRLWGLIRWLQRASLLRPPTSLSPLPADCLRDTPCSLHEEKTNIIPLHTSNILRWQISSYTLLTLIINDIRHLRVQFGVNPSESGWHQSGA